MKNIFLYVETFNSMSLLIDSARRQPAFIVVSGLGETKAFRISEGLCFFTADIKKLH